MHHAEISLSCGRVLQSINLHTLARLSNLFAAKKKSKTWASSTSSSKNGFKNGQKLFKTRNGKNVCSMWNLETETLGWFETFQILGNGVSNVLLYTDLISSIQQAVVIELIILVTPVQWKGTTRRVYKCSWDSNEVLSQWLNFAWSSQKDELKQPQNWFVPRNLEKLSDVYNVYFIST